MSDGKNQFDWHGDTIDIGQGLRSLPQLVLVEIEFYAILNLLLRNLNPINQLKYFTIETIRYLLNSSQILTTFVPVIVYNGVSTN